MIVHSIAAGKQLHPDGTAGNDLFRLDFALQGDVPTGVSGWNVGGHHVYGGAGTDTFNFVNLQNIRGVTVGRLDDLAANEVIQINGVNLNLAAGFGTSGGFAWKVVEWDTDPFDSAFGTQQWLVINTGEGILFYSLEADRTTPLGDGAAGFIDEARTIGLEERHFIHVDYLPTDQNGLLSEQAIWNLPSVKYIHPSQFRATDLFTSVEDDLLDRVYVAPNDSIADRIVGNSGNNALTGNGGNDKIAGGRGNDSLYGGVGNDTLDGGEGNDLILAGDHNDLVFGGFGADTLSGELGNDTIFGGAGNDVINGNNGNDVLFADVGDDTVYGGAGADRIDGGAGRDVLYGGVGSDTFVFTNGGVTFHERIADFGYNADPIRGDRIELNIDKVDDMSDLIFSRNADGTQFYIRFTEAPGRIILDSTASLTFDNLQHSTNFLFV